MTDTIWKIEDALTLIREVEPGLKEHYNCFLGLCGGVLRKGHSTKDLDLILIPMNGDHKPDLDGAKKWLEKKWGERKHEGITGFNQQFLCLNFCQYRNMKIDLITVL